MKAKELIEGREFMDKFIHVSNEIYKWSGDYKDVFEYFQPDLDGDEIEKLLDYCDRKNLLED
jgi:hypothetical protein